MSKFLKFCETAQILASPALFTAVGGGGRGGIANDFEFVHFSNLLIYSIKETTEKEHIFPLDKKFCTEEMWFLSIRNHV